MDIVFITMIGIYIGICLVHHPASTRCQQCRACHRIEKILKK